jgi:hypothetical protein
MHIALLMEVIDGNCDLYEILEGKGIFEYSIRLHEMEKISFGGIF